MGLLSASAQLHTWRLLYILFHIVVSFLPLGGAQFPKRSLSSENNSTRSAWQFLGIFEIWRLPQKQSICLELGRSIYFEKRHSFIIIFSNHDAYRKKSESTIVNNWYHFASYCRFCSFELQEVLWERVEYWRCFSF